jgi:hypothetical protein
MAAEDTREYRWLLHVITAYDTRASRRRGYNPWALPQYMEALDRAASMVDEGASWEAAISKCYNDRLEAACLKGLASLS